MSNKVLLVGTDHRDTSAAMLAIAAMVQPGSMVLVDAPRPYEEEYPEEAETLKKICQQPEYRDYAKSYLSDLFHGPLKPIVRATPKVGRNEPCPCGSGKKWKRCCEGKQ